jgi:hypothetical protein
MRIATVMMAAVMAIGLGASAPADDAGNAAEADAVPCGCGGPKAIYAAQYGTVQPPAMREAAEEASAGDGDTQPASVPSPESEGEGAGGGG